MSDADAEVDSLKTARSSVSTLSLSSRRETKPLVFSEVLVTFVASEVRLDPKNSPFTVYIIAVTARDDPDGDERLRVEKRYSAFVQLDEKLRKEMPHMLGKIGRLPEKSILKRMSPALVDARKQALQTYLQNVIMYLPNWPVLTAFLQSDIKPAVHASTSKEQALRGGQKEGYLSKRGRALHVWKPRYFVFHGGSLRYYLHSTTEAQPTGELSLLNATVEALADNEAEAVRHAFLLVNDGVRHVYCAENDPDRDDWVRVLSMHIEMMTPVWEEEASNDKAAAASDDGSPKKPATAGYASDDEEEDATGKPLIKEGVLLFKANLLVGWKQRLCQLVENGDFYVFNRVQKEANEKPSGIVSLNAYAFEEVGDAADQKNAFLLAPAAGTSGPRFLFCAASPEERAAWLAAMAPFHKESPKPPGSPPPVIAKKVGGSRFIWATKAIQQIGGSIGGSGGSQDSGSPGGAGQPRGPVVSAVFSTPESVLPASSAQSGDSSGNSGAFVHVPKEMLGELQDAPAPSVFGTPLAKSLELSKPANPLGIPNIVNRCIELVEAKGLEEEGIYRLSGSSSEIKDLRERFNAGEDVPLLESRADHNVVAGLLKQYLREIPDPILTDELRMSFFSTSTVEDRDLKLAKIARLLTMLPQANRDLLRVLMAHLRKVSEFEHINKMTVRNLGIVFSPTLQIPAFVFTLFMQEYDRIFVHTEETAAMDTTIDEIYDEYYADTTPEADGNADSGASNNSTADAASQADSSAPPDALEDF